MIKIIMTKDVSQTQIVLIYVFKYELWSTLTSATGVTHTLKMLYWIFLLQRGTGDVCRRSPTFINFFIINKNQTRNRCTKTLPIVQRRKYFFSAIKKPFYCFYNLLNSII